jgi:hypothetical protein
MMQGKEGRPSFISNADYNSFMDKSNMNNFSPETYERNNNAAGGNY